MGYAREKGQYTSSINWDMSWAGGAGALYSTVEDLYLWNEAVFNGKVLNEQSMKAAFTAGVLNNGSPIGNGTYGLGWGLNKFRGEEVIEHGGGLHGFISQLSRYRKNNMTVVILTNIMPPEISMNASAIAEYFLWPSLEAQPSFSVKQSAVGDVKPFVGRYDFQNGMVMTITDEGNNLFAQLTGQNKFPIFPAGNDEYFWKVVEARIKFAKDATGKVTHGDFTQNGQQLKVMKLPEQVFSKVDPALYTKFAGKFDYGSGMIITVTTENEKLFAQATNQPKFELFPVSDYDYVLKEVNIAVTFLRADDGSVKGMSITQGTQKKEAPRVE